MAQDTLHTPPPAPLARRSALRRWLTLVALTALLAGADQASKHWARTSLQDQLGGRVQVIEGYFALTFVKNPGAAWGFLARKSESFRRPFFLAVSLLAMGFILHLVYRLDEGQRLLLLALSMVMSGAVGNFIDRLRFSYVVDFLDFHWGTRFKWPTFNIADVAITVGVGLLFLEMALSALGRRRAKCASACVPPVYDPRSPTDPPGP